MRYFRLHPGGEKCKFPEVITARDEFHARARAEMRPRFPGAAPDLIEPGSGGEVDDDLIRPGCSRCGSLSIHGYDRVIAIAMCDGFTRNDAGELEPEWVGESDVDWNSQCAVDGDHPYICLTCHRPLSPEELELPTEA